MMYKMGLRSGRVYSENEFSTIKECCYTLKDDDRIGAEKQALIIFSKLTCESCASYTNKMTTCYTVRELGFEQKYILLLLGGKRHNG